jgi:co-chaperonin GroES (HSP10)
MSVGDRLARGDKSAQFAASGNSVDAPIELHNVAAEEPQDLSSTITVIDRRNSYDSKPVPKKELKYPEKSYEPLSTVLDRILIKRIPDDPNFEVLEDGSMRDKRTGFVIPATYRQHSRLGIVLATGQFAILGGVKVPMSDIVRPGYRVTFGDYTSEVFKLSEAKTEELCDAVHMNYDSDPDGLRIVRIQDVRTVEVPCKTQD